MNTAAPAEWPAPPGKDESGRSGSQVRGRQTLRMIVHTSIAGTTTRIHLVNTFSQEPVAIGHATIAHRAKGGAASGQPVSLTFGGGHQSTVLEPGGSVYSDPIAFAVKADEELLVSIHLPQPVATAPFHEHTLTTSYTSTPGDATDRSAETGEGSFRPDFPYWAFLDGIDVMAPNSGGTTVLLGDSQTSGGHTTPNTNRRWPDAYGRALQARDKPMGVVNAGISGNSLLSDHPDYGQSALNRFDRDVLAQPNVKSVILYEGINDISNGASATDLIDGIHRLAARARTAGIDFTAATIPPFRGYRPYSAAKEQVRRQVNEYIRTTRDIDSYVDFDQATRDPLDPTRLYAAYYNRGDDRLHFGDNGSQVLSDAVVPAPAPARVPSRFDQTTVADFTGDGIPDVIARDKNDEKAPLYHYTGNSDVDQKSAGDGTFALDKPLTDGWHYTQTTAGDFTGDGKPDIVAKGADDVLYLWPGEGNGRFGGKRKLRGGWHYTQTAAGDFTGDGTADLIARDADGSLRFWTGDGHGGIDEGVHQTRGWDFTQTTVADFTGDGKPDIVAKGADDVLYLWPGEGGRDFGRKQKLVDDWRYSETAALPFRAGGIAHLIGRSDTTGVLHERLNLGNGTFSSPLRLMGGW
ncbi:GDSL-type esterase/lipase family protein [Streptomyces sp. NPDC037389]|uniref:GDSL-type esterase/lipase family protein n=1 Tax=Streptomyces sp. NPDC037389 TaxID=3155369 RepID=UPI0033CAFA39